MTLRNTSHPKIEQIQIIEIQNLKTIKTTATLLLKRGIIYNASKVCGRKLIFAPVRIMAILMTTYNKG